jgi:hypothetical protein
MRAHRRGQAGVKSIREAWKLRGQAQMRGIESGGAGVVEFVKSPGSGAMEA